MKIAIGFDAYNQNLTGGVSMTLTEKRSDPHHVPLVIIDEDIHGEAVRRMGRGRDRRDDTQ